jgi:hypothetical protein
MSKGDRVTVDVWKGTTMAVADRIESVVAHE